MYLGGDTSLATPATVCMAGMIEMYVKVQCQHPEDGPQRSRAPSRVHARTCLESIPLWMMLNLCGQASLARTCESMYKWISAAQGWNTNFGPWVCLIISWLGLLFKS